MSYAAERWARAQVAGNARAKAVLIELANCFNERTGLCCPSAASIARVTELKADTVFSAIAHLVRCGLIRRSTSVGASNRYILVGFNPDEWPAKKDDKPTPKTGHPRKRGTPENGVPTYPENGVTPYPEFGVLTGNRNREEEQGNVVTPALEKPTTKTGYPENGVGPSPDDWASLLSETAPSDDVPTGLFDDMPPEPEPAPKPAAKKPKRSRAASDAWPVEGDGIDADTRAAYLAVRKAKRVGPFTAKAYEQIKAQGEKFGRSMVETLGICIGRGWVYPYDSAFQQTTMNGKSNGIQEDRRGFVLTPQSEYDYEAGLRMFEERRAARRARDA